MIDIDGLARERDQLWAEAIVRFNAGAKWWLETPALEALAATEQAARFKFDAWKEPVEQWIGARTDVSISEVLKYALGLAPQTCSPSAVNSGRQNSHRHRLRPLPAAHQGERPYRYRREKN